MSTNIRQEHSGEGDSITGDKYIFNNQSNYSTDLRTDINTRIESYKNRQNYDFEDSDVLGVCKDKIVELIQVEQEKSHGIVPMYAIRNIFKDLMGDDLFEKLINELRKSKQVELDEPQVCYIPKKLDYKVNLK
jgi:hypothetical protein